MRVKYYVVISRDGTWKLIKSATPPSTKEYFNVMGAFKTRKGAIYMATIGVGEPECQTVDDAERLSKRWSYTEYVMAETLYGALLGGAA